MNEIPSTTNVPSRYRAEWQRPEDNEWKSKHANISRITTEGGIAVMVGGRGTGKTRMAAEIIRDRLPIPSYYTTAMGIFLRIREAYAKASNETESGIVNQLSTCLLLVIDEIQERSNSEWEDRIITHIIDRRYGEQKPTIIIGNLRPDAMAASLGDSIVSRANESGGIIQFIGQSFRKPNP